MPTQSGLPPLTLGWVYNYMNSRLELWVKDHNGTRQISYRLGYVMAPNPPDPCFYFVSERYEEYGSLPLDAFTFEEAKAESMAILAKAVEDKQEYNSRVQVALSKLRGQAGAKP